MIERPRSIGEAWRKLIQQQEKIERLREYIQRPPTARAAEYCQGYDVIKAENEHLKSVVQMQGETIKDHEQEIDEDKAKIERLRKALEHIAQDGTFPARTAAKALGWIEED